MARFTVGRTGKEKLIEKEKSPRILCDLFGASEENEE